MDENGDRDGLSAREAQRGPGLGLRGCIVPILKGIAWFLGFLVVLVYVGQELSKR